MDTIHSLGSSVSEFLSTKKICDLQPCHYKLKSAIDGHCFIGHNVDANSAS